MISEFKANNCIEYFVALELPVIGSSFQERLEALFEEYDKLCKEKELSLESLLYIKIYLSDISNQAECIKEYIKQKYASIFYILVGQAPASGAKISIESYFCKPANDSMIKRNITGHKMSIRHGSYSTSWGNLTADIHGNSFEQTNNILNNLTSELAKSDGNIKDNVLRTWFYMRDIDNSYHGMVESRKKWFEKENMTKETHYIASTGIEGNSSDTSSLVQLCYITSFGLKKEQVTFMKAPGYMNPTHEYGVTFERGTKVTYGDRAHYYISGTASIDDKGNVLFLNDVIKQIERAFENVEALLSGYNAGLNDLKLLIVYLRDYSDYQAVYNYLRSRLEDTIPFIILNAPICRYNWLVEIEGIAINDDNNDKFKAFL